MLSARHGGQQQGSGGGGPGPVPNRRCQLEPSFYALVSVPSWHHSTAYVTWLAAASPCLEVARKLEEEGTAGRDTKAIEGEGLQPGPRCQGVCERGGGVGIVRMVCCMWVGEVGDEGM